MSRTATAPAIAIAIAASWAAPAPAAAEERLSLTMRGAAFDRDDAGYADHAAVFGAGDPETAGGGAFEVGVRVLPRIWLLGSWSGFTSLGPRRLDELRVTNRAVLAHIGVTALRREISLQGEPTTLRLDLLAGAGIYRLSDQLGDETRTARGPGLRAGLQLGYSWRAVGLALAYGWHATRVELEDRLGGTIGAGGHEIGMGLTLHF